VRASSYERKYTGRILDQADAKPETSSDPAVREASEPSLGLPADTESSVVSSSQLPSPPSGTEVRPADSVARAYASEPLPDPALLARSIAAEVHARYSKAVRETMDVDERWPGK
jgi:hypothetical protein